MKIYRVCDIVEILLNCQKIWIDGYCGFETNERGNLMNENIERRQAMQKAICIPIEQYEAMVASYDKVVSELEEMKKALKEAATSPRAE